MALDEKTLERMLKAQKDALEKAKPPAKSTPPPAGERKDLYEEFVRNAQPGEPPKPKGLNAAGYKFPPETPGSAPAMTKANMAKGIGLPVPTPQSAAPPPPTELIEKDSMFEEYQRPDLKHHPRTGKGLRSNPPEPKTAKEILKDYEPPTPQVYTPRRTPTGTPASNAPKGGDVEADAAHLDAEADLASAAELTMSHSRHHGPQKTVTKEDPFLDMPTLPSKPAPTTTIPDPAPAVEAAHAKPSPRVAAVAPAQAAHHEPPHPSKAAQAPAHAPSHAPSPAPATAHASHDTTHVSDAPPVRPGLGPRIGIVQADFNHDITTRMAEECTAYAKQLGGSVVHHLHVAGAFDIPLTAKLLAARKDVDAVVAIGCIIQGETDHDEIIGREVARKLADLAYECGKPIGLAVLGPRITKAQAEARIHTGRHAAAAVTQQWRGLQALGSK